MDDRSSGRYASRNDVNQDDMDRAKAQRRKGKPKQAVLCVLASLRETGFPWLLKVLDGIQNAAPDLFRSLDWLIVHQDDMDRAKTQRKTKTGCSSRLGVFARDRISLAVKGLGLNSKYFP